MDTADYAWVLLQCVEMLQLYSSLQRLAWGYFWLNFEKQDGRKSRFFVSDEAVCIDFLVTPSRAKVITVRVLKFVRYVLHYKSLPEIFLASF